MYRNEFGIVSQDTDGNMALEIPAGLMWEYTEEESLPE